MKAEVDSLGIYAYDQKKHLNSRARYFDVAYSNVPNDENSLLDQIYNSKKGYLMLKIVINPVVQHTHRHILK